jgi:hypothetical protein
LASGVNVFRPLNGLGDQNGFLTVAALQRCARPAKRALNLLGRARLIRTVLELLMRNFAIRGTPARIAITLNPCQKTGRGVYAK